MSYVTKQGLIDRFGSELLIQLTDRENVPPEEIDDTVVDRAIGDAKALIDGYLGKVYRLPLTVVPAILTKIAADVAWYNLHGAAAEKDQVVAINYRGAVDWLKDVSKGLVQLDLEGVTPASAGGGSVRTKNPDRVFTRDSLRGA